MTYAQDHRLSEAKARDIVMIADKLEIRDLERSGIYLIGPCPKCGGHDRFSINTLMGLFQCRKCDGKGDVIHLVRWMRDCTLPAALDWICGPLDVAISAEEREERRKRSEENKARNDERAQRERQKAIADARSIWQQGRPPEGTAVRDYLALRGFGRDVLPELPICLRWHPDLPYMVRLDRDWQEVHRGPAMLAVVQMPPGQGTAVHRTWIDLSQAKGKPVLTHPVSGKPLPAKKVLGSKKGGAIRLRSPKEFDTLVMAEGIETTLTAMIAGLYPDAAFWAGVDLGNIAGARKLGPGLKYAGIPDLGDQDCFRPPPWVKRLILIEDGDSDPRDTRAKLLAGARRAMALVPGLRAQIVPCPAGSDLNDLLMDPEEVA